MAGWNGRRMSKARLVITAVVIEGRSQGEVARGLRRVPGLGFPAGRPVPGRRRGRVRAAVPAPQDRTAATPRRPSISSSGSARNWAPRSGRRGPHHQVAPRTTITRSSAAGDGLAVPDGQGWWSPSRRSARNGLTSGSRPRSPTKAGRPTSPTIPVSPSRTGTQILTWLDDYSRYALSVTAQTGSPAPS